MTTLIASITWNVILLIMCRAGTCVNNRHTDFNLCTFGNGTDNHIVVTFGSLKVVSSCHGASFRAIFFSTCLVCHLFSVCSKEAQHYYHLLGYVLRTSTICCVFHELWMKNPPIPICFAFELWAVAQNCRFFRWNHKTAVWWVTPDKFFCQHDERVPWFLLLLSTNCWAYHSRHISSDAGPASLFSGIPYITMFLQRLLFSKPSIVLFNCATCFWTLFTIALHFSTFSLVFETTLCLPRSFIVSEWPWSTGVQVLQAWHHATWSTAERHCSCARSEPRCYGTTWPGEGLTAASSGKLLRQHLVAVSPWTARRLGCLCVHLSASDRLNPVIQ